VAYFFGHPVHSYPVWDLWSTINETKYYAPCNLLYNGKQVN